MPSTSQQTSSEMDKLKERKPPITTGEDGMIQVVELHMMNKTKYFPLTMLSGFTIRTFLFPFSVIKTRLQIQKHKAVYNGTFDAFKKIARFEGYRGLFKGYWVSQLFIVPQMTYIGTYETVRQMTIEKCDISNHSLRSFIAGGCASIASQTFMVPIDVVSQHLMIMGSTRESQTTHGPKPAELDHLPIKENMLDTRMGRTMAVIRAIHARDGFFGFYKGYLASLSVYAPNSAMWWFFYQSYSSTFADLAPDWIPRLLLQVSAAPMSGITTSFITQPLDTVRARIQIDGTRFMPTARLLWAEEGMNMFIKGLSARLVQSISFSFFIILGYESIKRWSLLDEYKDLVRW